jgi:hypothetical protein
MKSSTSGVFSELSGGRLVNFGEVPDVVWHVSFVDFFGIQRALQLRTSNGELIKRSIETKIARQKDKTWVMT